MLFIFFGYCLPTSYNQKRVHAVGVCRFYVCKPGETQWQYTGLYGGAAVVTEANLQLSCAHFIRLVDLDGFNPVSKRKNDQKCLTCKILIRPYAILPIN